MHDLAQTPRRVVLRAGWQTVILAYRTEKRQRLGNEVAERFEDGARELYHKCPVCGTAGTFKTALTDWSFATREPTRCKTCGYVLPVAPEFSDAVARSCLMN